MNDAEAEFRATFLRDLGRMSTLMDAFGLIRDWTAGDQVGRITRANLAFFLAGLFARAAQVPPDATPEERQAYVALAERLYACGEIDDDLNRAVGDAVAAASAAAAQELPAQKDQ